MRVLAFVLSLFLIACGDDPTLPAAPPEKPPASPP